MTSIEYTKALSFIDRLYNFYFLDHKKQFFLSSYVFFIAISYITINVFILERNENRAIYESVFLTISIYVIFPILYCSYIYNKKRGKNIESVTFNSIFYGKINSRSIQWQSTTRRRHHKVISRRIWYRTDKKMHSNIFCD